MIFNCKKKMQFFVEIIAFSQATALTATDKTRKFGQNI